MMHLFRGRVQQNPQQNKKTSETQVLPETTWADEEMPSGIPPEGSVVITISRQFGSGGTHIGRLVAEKSQLNYVDQEIIDEVARRLGVPAQQTTGTVRHILEAIQSSNPFALNYSTFFGPNIAQAQSKELAYF